MTYAIEVAWRVQYASAKDELVLRRAYEGRWGWACEARTERDVAIVHALEKLLRWSRS